MSLIDMQISYKVVDLDKIIDFDGVTIGMLKGIGAKIRNKLYRSFLKGQELNVKFGRDSSARRITRYSIKKKGQHIIARVTSLPLNLWEHGFERRGRYYKGKKVFSLKLPPLAEPIIKQYGEEYMKGISKGIERRANKA